MHEKVTVLPKCCSRYILLKSRVLDTYQVPLLDAFCCDRCCHSVEVWPQHPGRFQGTGSPPHFKEKITVTRWGHTQPRGNSPGFALNLYPLSGSGTSLRNVATSCPVWGSLTGHRRVGSSATHAAGDLSQGKGHGRNTISSVRLVVCLPWKETGTGFCFPYLLGR